MEKIIKQSIKNAKKHGLDCHCIECEKIKKLIRDGVHSGNIHLVGLPEDKHKVMQRYGYDEGTWTYKWGEKQWK